MKRTQQLTSLLLTCALFFGSVTAASHMPHIFAHTHGATTLSTAHGNFERIISDISSRAPYKYKAKAIGAYNALLQAGNQHITDALGVLSKKLQNLISSPFRFFKTRSRKERALISILNHVEARVAPHLTAQTRPLFRELRRSLHTLIGAHFTGPLGIRWSKKKALLTALIAIIGMDLMRGKNSFIKQKVSSGLKSFEPVNRTINNANQMMENVNNQFGSKGGAKEGSLADTVLKKVETVTNTIENLEKPETALGGTLKTVQESLRNIEDQSTSLGRTVTNANDALGRVKQQLNPDGSIKPNSALETITGQSDAALQTARDVLRNIEDQSTSLGRTVTNANDALERVKQQLKPDGSIKPNSALDTITGQSDAALQTARDVLRDIEDEHSSLGKTVAEIRQTAKSVRTTLDNIEEDDSKLGQALQQTQAFIDQTTRALKTLNGEDAHRSDEGAGAGAGASASTPEKETAFHDIANIIKRVKVLVDAISEKEGAQKVESIEELKLLMNKVNNPGAHLAQGARGMALSAGQTIGGLMQRIRDTFDTTDEYANVTPGPIRL